MADRRTKRLTRDDVLDAALALAQAEGVDAVTMRAVAARLDVTPMALYRHVGDKQGLLDGLVERLLDELPTPSPSEDWRGQLVVLMGALREAARRYPEAFLMLLRRPATTPSALRRRDSVYDLLRAAGVTEDLLPRIERLLDTFALGFAASEGGGRFSQETTATLDADLAWAFEHVLEPLIAAIGQGG